MAWIMRVDSWVMNPASPLLFWSEALMAWTVSGGMAGSCTEKNLGVCFSGMSHCGMVMWGVAVAVFMSLSELLVPVSSWSVEPLELILGVRGMVERR